MKNKYYLAVINTNGLISNNPILCNRQADYTDSLWWNKSDNWSVDTSLPQLQVFSKLIQFWSEDKKEVEQFILGAKAMSTIFKDMCFFTLPDISKSTK